MPAGTQPGTVVTPRGRGMPTVGRGRRGDQRVVLNVVVPRNLSNASELPEELRDSITEHNLEEADESLLEGEAGLPADPTRHPRPAEDGERVLAALLELAPEGFEQVDGDVAGSSSRSTRARRVARVLAWARGGRGRARERERDRGRR